MNSISCTDATGYTPCSADDSWEICEEKSVTDGFAWRSYGDNEDLSEVDLSQIAISHDSDGKPLTVYQNSDCSGPSMSLLNLLDGTNEYTKDFVQSYGDYQVNAIVDELSSIRIPSNYAVSMSSASLDERTSPF